MHPTLCGRAILWFAAILFVSSASVGSMDAQEKKSSDDGRGLTRDQAKKLKNPVRYSKKSITQGRTALARLCTGCHGADAKAQMDVVANATDLTSPAVWLSGTSDGEIFRSIRDGAGETMPPFNTQITQESDLWNLVNFIRSLWPESTRPALQEPPPDDPSAKRK